MLSSLEKLVVKNFMLRLCLILTSTTKIKFEINLPVNFFIVSVFFHKFDFFKTPDNVQVCRTSVQVS